MDVNDTLDTLLSQYGDGSKGDAPTRAQWQRILDRDPAKPFALINFFKFSETASYDTPDPVSGMDAFQRYAAVSMPAMHEAGGEFLLAAPFAGNFLGDDQDWDMVAIGKYPNLHTFLTLYQNPAYIDAFAHRRAAVAKQVVFVTET